jgi:putative membrane protein
MIKSKDTWHEENDTDNHCSTVDFDIGFRGIGRRENRRELDAWHQPDNGRFVKEAAMSDMTEIAAAKVGKERGNAQEKTFTSQMITDHTKTTDELKAMASAGAKVAIPSAPDSSSQSKVDKLKDAKPDDFSSDFDSMQVSAHKDAVSLFERYAKGGEDPKLKDWAGKTLPALQHHLEMAQNLGKTK